MNLVETQLLTFWTLCIILFFVIIIYKRRFGDWTVSPSSGKSLLSWAQFIELVPISRNSIYSINHINCTYPVGLGTYFPGVTQQGREADHSSPSSAEIKNGGATPQHPHMSSWHDARLMKRRENFTFTFTFCHDTNVSL
jgi:hypothetical protein